MKRFSELLDEIEDAAFVRGVEHERRGSQYHDACDRHKAARLALVGLLSEVERERDEARAEVARLTGEKEEVIEEAAVVISEFADCDCDLALKDFRAIIAAKEAPDGE